MKSPISDLLCKMFQTHRVLFWYDDDKSLRKDFEAAEVDAVRKIGIRWMWI
ncbi:MAG TPA: hypothetical protein PLY87_15990 [Planctomycetaceae bacterium]|nr:hypothetical protein [Planctomycetaceae bacterium]